MTTQLNNTTYELVDVPEDANSLELSTGFLCYISKDDDFYKLLPPGDYTLIGLAKDCDEDLQQMVKSLGKDINTCVILKRHP